MFLKRAKVMIEDIYEGEFKIEGQREVSRLLRFIRK
jgi:hypothetical protein